MSLRTVVGTALQQYEVLWVTAGDSHAAVPMSYGEPLRVTVGMRNAVKTG